MQNDDVNHKGILIFLAILAATLVVVYGAVTALWRHWQMNARADDARELSLTSPAIGEPYFPQPREQPNPMIDLNAWRLREDEDATNYGWIDRSNGIVRIPIERAMEIIVQRGGTQ
jgi:hypothetical protein